jgi:DNA-binding MarR family transcriptional regulator
VTGTVDRLANAGLIRREVHPGDRRRRVVALTETGAGCLRDLVRDAREVSDRLLAVLTADERAELRATARRVLDHHDGRRRVSTESPDHGV